MKEFSHIDTWVFDLDHTLYDAESHVFVEIGNRMTHFVAEHLGLAHEEAKALRKTYFQKYGTTIEGLHREHGIEPSGFLKKIYDIDLSFVPACAITQNELSNLPGRKIIFTSAPRHFAERMVSHLGLTHHFEGLFAFDDAGFRSKPNLPVYHAFLKTFSVDPKTACMFEDMEQNLKTAHDLGMTTVWFHWNHEEKRDQNHAHVHHKHEKLTDWLEKHVKNRS